jgi:hypothetical protein
MPHNMSKPTSLAIRIARCDDLPRARSDANHPCHRIASHQRTSSDQEHWQVPEPWRGQLDRAPLLFISSNPSIDQNDDCPWDFDPDERITSYFDTGGIASNFPRSTSRDGTVSSRNVPFWVSVNARAKELFDRDLVRPGIDYAISEVVHCKSTREIGVSEACGHCTGKFLGDLLRVSDAAVVVTLGRHAAQALSTVHLRDSVLRIGLPHPNARTERTAGACLSPAELQAVRKALAPRLA